MQLAWCMWHAPCMLEEALGGGGGLDLQLAAWAQSVIAQSVPYLTCLSCGFHLWLSPLVGVASLSSSSMFVSLVAACRCMGFDFHQS